MRTLRIILVLLAVTALTPLTLGAHAGESKGGKALVCAKNWFPATGQTAPYTAEPKLG